MTYHGGSIDVLCVAFVQLASQRDQLVTVFRIGSHRVRHATKRGNLRRAVLSAKFRHSRPFIPFQRVRCCLQYHRLARLVTNGIELFTIYRHWSNRLGMGVCQVADWRSA